MKQGIFHAANPFSLKIKFFFAWKLVIVYLRESLKAYLPVGTFHIIIDKSKSRLNLRKGSFKNVGIFLLGCLDSGFFFQLSKNLAKM